MTTWSGLFVVIEYPFVRVGWTRDDAIAAQINNKRVFLGQRRCPKNTLRESDQNNPSASARVVFTR
jgi:hypothetical protein